MIKYARYDSHYLLPVFNIFQKLAASSFKVDSELSEELQDQDWLTKVQSMGVPPDFDALSLIAQITNKFIVQKLCKNNQVKVLV